MHTLQVLTVLIPPVIPRALARGPLRALALPLLSLLGLRLRSQPLREELPVLDLPRVTA